MNSSLMSFGSSPSLSNVFRVPQISFLLFSKCNSVFVDFEFESIEIIGLCTDICVVSNALIIKALYPEIPITVDASCCAGTSPKAHQAALMTMESCQIQVINNEG